MKLTDEFGLPTVHAATVMFDVFDRVREHREGAPLAQRPMMYLLHGYEPHDAATRERARLEYAAATGRSAS